MRLDNYLVENNFFNSRNKASEFIKNGKIKVNNKIIKKPSFNINNATIEVLADIFVSRAALKLNYFLDEIQLNLNSLNALDIGSSTGGFSQILLQKGVKSLVCVDVGTNQLHSLIKNDNRVTIFENTDIRDFKSDILFDIIVCDVSFISILKIVDVINKLAKDKIILLFKPQFEVGKDIKRDKHGVVIDKKAILLARENFILNIKKLNWKLLYNNYSKIAGKNGNIEELFLWKKINN